MTSPSSPGSVLPSNKNWIPNFSVSLAKKAKTPPCFWFKIGWSQVFTSLPVAPLVLTPWRVKNWPDTWLIFPFESLFQFSTSLKLINFEENFDFFIKFWRHFNKFDIFYLFKNVSRSYLSMYPSLLTSICWTHN